jgi:hypothetical protein
VYNASYKGKVSFADFFPKAADEEGSIAPLAIIEEIMIPCT